MAAEKNLARSLSANFGRLTREVLVAFPRSGFDLYRTIVRLRHGIWGDDLTTGQKRDALFGTRGWDDLPMAVLAARYLQLPTDRLPHTRKDLADLCRWLMSRDGDETLIDTCVRGWAGGNTPLMALDGFVDELWRTREQDATFFAVVVCGQHAAALKMIAARQLSPQLDDDLAIGILARMALIWAAFDCQATAARARRSMTRPMGWLIIGAGARIRASTLVSVFRPIADALRKFVGGYRTGEVRVSPEKPRSRIPAVMDIRANTTAHAEHLDAAEGAFALDLILNEVVTRSGQSSNPFFVQVSQDRTDSAFGDRQLSQFWYAGLLPLQIVGMAAMRLAQMEQQLELLLRDTVTRAREKGTKPRLMVPDFDDLPLLPGWKGRSRAIADALRGAVLRDTDRHSIRQSRARAAGIDEMMDGAAHDDQFIDAVQLFLARAGRYGPVMGREAWTERRQVFDELDVASGMRFGTEPRYPVT